MQDQLIKAEEAKQLLNNPILKDAFKVVRDKLITAGENAGMNDIETQHNIILSLQLLKQLQSQIQSYINDGTIAEFKLKQKESLAKKLFR